MILPGRSGRLEVARPWRTASMALLLALLLCVPFARLPQPSAGLASTHGTPIATPATTPDDATVAVDDRTTVTVAFPVGLQVTGELHAPAHIGTLSLLYQTGYDDGWNLVDIPASDLTPTTIGVSIDTVIDLQALQIPIGAHLRYRWLVAATDDEPQAVSAITETDWYDNRQPWETLNGRDVTLHSYGMTPAFAQAILDSAQGTVDDLKVRFDLASVTTITLWIYPDADAFQQGLPANFRESVVGGSVVGYPLLAAVIPPGSTSEIGRVIPHEISHQMLFQATRNPFTLVPTWFDEGVATHIQIGGTSGYMGMVFVAERRGGLFDLTSLSASFPYTASQASLAYAASWSAITYIEARWGEDGIIAMIHAFAKGLPEDQAMQHALGVSVTTFDRDWKSWIHEKSEDIGHRT